MWRVIRILLIATLTHVAASPNLFADEQEVQDSCDAQTMVGKFPAGLFDKISVDGTVIEGPGSKARIFLREDEHEITLIGLKSGDMTPFVDWEKEPSMGDENDATSVDIELIGSCTLNAPDATQKFRVEPAILIDTSGVGTSSLVTIKGAVVKIN